MTDTQKRIQAYKDALPGLKERVAAVALLLAMSFAMMTSASFAWLTISRRPEVTGVNTTVAANGSLEIALVSATGTKPADSAVGDSSATKGQSVTSANITWGNLVNLSDASYGLENLTLRPAQLNTASLLASPLYGAMYGEDGRITQLSSNFGYATWNLPEGNKPGYFGVSENYGVRAISSTKMEAVGAEAIFYNMVTTANNQNLAAANMYVALGNNEKYMPSLATMMGLYMTARMNPSDETLSNPTCDIEDVQNLRDMYAAFLECFDAEAQAMASLVNLQLFLQKGDGNYTPYTVEMIYNSTTAGLKGLGLQLTDLDQFIKDRNTISSDYAKLVEICQAGTSLEWKDSGLNTIVNNLVNVGDCTIGADNTPISSIGASNAVGYLSGTQEARITNGILYRYEERTGGYIEVKGLGISAKVKRSGITVPATVKANIQTTASRDYNLFSNDLTYAQSLNTGNYQGGTLVAEDTYGLAIDLWVRTNAPASYLTLEGNVLTIENEARATGVDANGNTVELWTVTISTQDEESNSYSYSVDLYAVKTTVDGAEVTTWYNAENHSVVTTEDMGGATPLPKMETVTTVVGYEGENRIWGDDDTLSVDATTQGSGSCYVYYADTPEDQARSLKLLEAFNVAFVSADGKLIGKAVMDTENYYAANGRVIVPLILDPSSSINLGEDYEGNTSYGLMALEQNVATWITAIVYLDGTKLTNQEVLAASDIQGQLNIQFGSSQALTPIGNETLENAERRVSASVDQTAFDYDTATEPMTTNVTVHVDGDEPSTVTAFFMRAISSTQGSREETMTFTQNASGDWVASYTFDSPGKYVLRTVRLDGVDYDLENPPEVNISGFTVSSLSCTQASGNHVNIMTANNSSTVDLNLKFASDDASKMPATVVGRFLNDEDGSAVNVSFKYNSTSQIWSGSATFLTSGNYTMQYLVLDGNYVELDSALWQTAHVVLGMRVAVYTTSPHSFKYVPSEMKDNEKLLAIQVKIMDNAGNEMPGLSGVKLTYGMKGSGIKTMDADLTWNGSYYVGELTTTGPGIWQFSNVVVGVNTVGVNTLTTATTSPTFTILSPEPPEYYDHITVESQYKPDNDAVMNVQITNSAAARVQAYIYIIKDGVAEGGWVNGTLGGEFTTTDGTSVNNWFFKVPTDANGYQDGNWTLSQLKLWDVFAADGTAYTEEYPLVLDVSDNVTKVVSRVYVTFAKDRSQDFGKDAEGNVTGAFMQSYNISGLNVNIKDFEGKAVDNVTDVTLTFTYQSGSSGTYGGYTSDSLTNVTNGATVTVALDSNSGTNYAQSEDATILYAGAYYTGLRFKINGVLYAYGDVNGDGKVDTAQIDNVFVTEQTMPANAPVFTVWSKAPVVTVTGTNPAPGTTYRIYTVSEPTDTSTIVSGDFFRYTDYTAAVYIYTNTSSGTYDQEAAHTYAPTVSLKLEGVPTEDFTSASMSFVTSNANSINSTFTFDSSMTATTTVGRAVDGSESWTGTGVSSWPKSYPAGRMVQNKLTLVFNGITYEITLENAITIDQPQAPSVLMFTGIPTTFTGTKPAQVLGDGNTVTVTLPTISWTAHTEEASENATWSAYTAVGTNEEHRVYTVRDYTTGSGWSAQTHKDYQYYDWTTFRSECTDTITYYMQDMQILKWEINGRQYDAGTTVQITAEGLITAKAVVTAAGEKIQNPNKAPQVTTTNKYLYGYVTGSVVTATKAGSNYYYNWAVYTDFQNYTSVTSAPSLAVPTSANAANDTVGTNMTTDPDGYSDFLP